LFLFGFNPLLLHELVGDGHLDGWAVTLALASLWWFHRSRIWTAASAAWLPMMIKLSFLATAAATAVLLIVRRQIVVLAITSIAIAAISVALYVLLDPDPARLLQVTDPDALGHENSLYHWFEQSLIVAGTARASARMLATLVARVAMLAFATFAAWRYTKIRSLDDLVAELAMLFLVLLLFGSRMWPWYLAWLLPFAVLTRSTAVQSAALVYSFTSLLLYTPDSWPRLRIAAAMFALVVPAADWLSSTLASRRHAK
jgi:hypothetical protein